MTPRRIGLAFLLNIFVIPGAGQFALKQKLRGVVWIAMTLVLVAVFFVHIFVIVREKLLQLSHFTIHPSQAESVAMTLTDGVLKQHGDVFMMYLYGLLVCYLLSCLDLVYIIYRERKGGKPVRGDSAGLKGV